MATVEWTGKQMPDPAASGDVFIQARVNGKNVSVHVSAEAIQDHGVPACMTVAEGKIRAGMQGDEPPARIEVRTSDFR